MRKRHDTPEILDQLEEGERLDLPFVEYDAANRELTLEHLSGHRYVYADFPMELWVEMLKAENRAVFYHRKIRGRYKSRRLDAPA